MRCSLRVAALRAAREPELPERLFRDMLSTINSCGLVVGDAGHTSM
jgi:hypothetical protein